MGCGQSVNNINNEDLHLEVEDEEPLNYFNEGVKWKITQPSEELTTFNYQSPMVQRNQTLSTRSIGLKSQNLSVVSQKSCLKEPSQTYLETEFKLERKVHFNQRIKVISFVKPRKSTSASRRRKTINLDEIF